MGGGIILGVFWGVLLSMLVAGIVSLSTPLPPGQGAGTATGEQADTSVTTPASEASAAASSSADGPDPAQAEEPQPDAARTDAAGSPGEGPSTSTGEADGASPEDARPAQSEPGDPIPLPSGSEFNRPPPDEEAVLPETDTAPGGEAPGAPPVPLQTFSQGVDTSPAPAPEISVAPGAPQPAAPDTGAFVLPQVTEGQATQPSGLRPDAVAAPEPDAAAAPDASSAPPPETAGSRVDGSGTVGEGAAVDPSASGAAETALGTDADEAAEAETSSPVIRLVPPRDIPETSLAQADDPSSPAAAAPATAPDMAPVRPRILTPGSDDAATGARTLPQIVVPGRSEQPLSGTETGRIDSVTDDTSRTETADVAEAEEDLPALVAHAAPFDAAETRPLIAVVLIDDPDTRLDLATLTDFSFPVSFAIDPMRADAEERAAAYRTAGFEVLLLGSAIPEGATAADTEIALAAAMRRVPEAVAVIDTPESRIQSDRAVLEATIGAAAGEGQGLLAFPRGLNTAEQMAARQGVPAATLFRLLDDEGQSAPVITRFLSRAEFAAVQEGVAIVAGRTRPDTVTALYSWALGNRNEGVAIAPVSAALRRMVAEARAPSGG